MDGKVNSSLPAWKFPDQLQRSDGNPRQVGVEIELQDIHVAELAIVVAEALNGTIRRRNSAEYAIEVPEQGDYRIEIDSSTIKRNAEAKAEGSAEPALMDIASRVVDGLGSLVVPCEIVSPPLPMSDVGEPMDSIVAAVRDAGGKGTQHSPLYAFGVHLNVEPANLEPGEIVDYLRAFVCLYDWIVEDGDVDTMRQLLPYIKKFPTAYEDRLLAPDYAPDWPTLTADYLADNPTRNRALDMLPMLAHINEQAVRSVVDDDLIKPRPAFHFRLANCCIDDPEWSVALPWSRWYQIEALAADKDRLRDCCAAFADNRSRFLSSIDSPWQAEVQQWLIAS